MDFKNFINNRWVIAIVAGCLFLGLSYLIFRLPTQNPEIRCYFKNSRYGQDLSTIILKFQNTGNRDLFDLKASITFSEKIQEYSSLLFDSQTNHSLQNNNQTLTFGVDDVNQSFDHEILLLFQKAAIIKNHKVLAKHYFEYNGRLRDEQIDGVIVEKNWESSKFAVYKILFFIAVGFSIILIIGFLFFKY